MPATIVALSMLFASDASADPAGTVHFTRQGDSAFDQYLSNPSPEAQEWLRTHIWRMTVWSPYFDNKTSWFSNGWVYDDAYAIYAGEQLASQHPEWILKDGAGNNLYIPFGCSGGSCPQYAADISDPAYRQYWIERLKAELAHGYRGVFIDDVNMDMRVGNGQEELVAPIDPSTGQPMTEDAWRHYMAQFMQEVREALPGIEIVHNAIWFADEHAGSSNPDIKSELSSANMINLERGANDPGLTGGEGPWSLNAFLDYVDEVHALGAGVVMAGEAGDPQGLEYNLAAYFLISDGNDAVSGAEQTPANWWPGWSTSLGEAAGPRYTWQHLLRRDFSGGMVLLNPPGEPTRTVTLPAPMRDVAGSTVDSVTLGAGSAAILSGAGAAGLNDAASSAPRTTLTTVEPTILSAALGAPEAQRSQRRSARQGRAQGVNSRPSRSMLVRISGRVLRAPRGEVTIVLGVRRGHVWSRLGRAATKLNSEGRFGLLVRLRAGRRYRVLALYAGAAGYRPSRSRYRGIAVGPR